jgi:hypothetical protein
MRKKQKKQRNLLFAAVGSVAAFFGLRGLIRWLQNRSSYEEYLPQSRSIMPMPGSEVYNQYQTEVAAVPVTGEAALAVEEQVDEAILSGLDLDDRQETEPQGMTGMQQGVSQYDTQANQAMERNRETGSQQENMSDDLLEPFSRVLMSFHSMVNLLHSRRAESGSATAGQRSLSSEDMSTFQETIDNVQEPLSDMGKGNLGDRSLQKRMYDLMMKVQDGLQNNEYTDDDLLRIYDEVKTEVCQLTPKIQSAGSGIETNIDIVRQVYDCG